MKSRETQIRGGWRRVCLLICMVVVIVSCADNYDSDIESLRAEIAKQKEMIAAMQNQFSITNVVTGDNFCTLSFSNARL